jgi:hypothetical protein
MQKKDRPKGRRLNLVIFDRFGGAFVPTFLPLDKLVKANLIWLKYIRYFIFKFVLFQPFFLSKVSRQNIYPLFIGWYFSHRTPTHVPHAWTLNICFVCGSYHGVSCVRRYQPIVELALFIELVN